MNRKLLKSHIDFGPSILRSPNHFKWILEAFSGLDRARDFRLPPNLDPELVEAICDRMKIPCGTITGNDIALAPTYQMLYAHECSR